MAGTIGKGILEVTFDRDQIGRDLHSSIESGAKSAEGGIGSTFKRLAGVASAAFAGVQVFSFFKDAVEGAREANKIAAQTEAVIASTGGAAGVTAEQFSKLAESISLKTGIDDEQIQSAENLLATFTNLKNGVGEGNDIFSQATKIAVDMGAALGGDASSNAIQLGKALQDPIKGITALTRVGVTFTAEQKNLIKSLQESGDMAGAQKVILAELNKEFGGSAEATATAGAKFGVFWGNLQEKIGNFLIPLMDSAATWAMTTLPNAFGVLQDTVGPIIERVAGWVSEFWNTLTTGFTEDEGTSVERWALHARDAIGLLVGAVQALAGWITGTLLPALVGFGQWLLEHPPIIQGIAIAIGTILVGAFVAWAASAAAAAVATLLALAPLILVGVAIAAVAAAFIYAYQNFDGFRTAVDAVASFITGTLLPALANVASFLQLVFNVAVGTALGLWGRWGPAITGVKDALDGFILVGFNAVMMAHNAVMGTAFQIWSNLAGPISTILDLLLTMVGAARAAAEAIRDIPIIGGATGGGGPIGGVVGGAILGIPGAIAGALGLPDFDEGGTVPGVTGTPQLVVAHGGERILSLDEQSQGNTYQLSSGPVYIADQQDVQVAFQRLELLAGGRR